MLRYFMSKIEFASKGMFGSSQITGYPRVRDGGNKEILHIYYFRIRFRLGNYIR